MCYSGFMEGLDWCEIENGESGEDLVDNQGC